MNICVLPCASEREREKEKMSWRMFGKLTERGRCTQREREREREIMLGEVQMDWD